MAFITVVAAALLSAGVLVTLFSFGLRLGDGEARWRRPLSVLMFVLCAVGVAFGLYLIVGNHLVTLFGG
ncbi:hypothetical protein [Protaetiibacter larvae]|uniref:Uncharacterized protein n=1 Tax=Protaetiibacter larvae TaxID=2592654 RepID=A0A5C1Y863_9MICO|nr:hypothetical protein [Protaetiibacter larvae]QEO10293.1 hypothetical protein FLP23_09900 [Protaetiibacter larvae]